MSSRQPAAECRTDAPFTNTTTVRSTLHRSRIVQYFRPVSRTGVNYWSPNTATRGSGIIACDLVHFLCRILRPLHGIMCTTLPGTTMHYARLSYQY